MVDQILPEIGMAAVKLLQRGGYQVDFPASQTCCGQPAYNSGYQEDARAVAERFLSIFDKALKNEPGRETYVVCPSGSCSSMVKVFYQDLFKNSPKLLNKVSYIKQRTYEFSEFLVKVLNMVDVGAEYDGVITYHDSCHLLRELRIKEGPRQLINAVKGVKFKEMEMHDACCGFGGTFSIKFPKVSVSMLDEKIECIVNSGADTVVSADMGCLMNIGGALSRRNIPIKIMHLAELLASRGK